MDQYSKFKRGSLLRIRLKNFLTYSEVTIYPGPKLNLVVGPNGTGKSSIVCAIALGLGGHPRVLGRASKLKEFVKHGEDEGFIEIDIKDGDENSNHYRTIRRMFSCESDASTWLLDGRQAKQNQISELVADMNIQIGNYLTFLPQDKVGNFSNQKPDEILDSTLEALDPQLLEVKKELIKMESSSGSEAQQREVCADRLERLRAEQAELAREKEAEERRAQLLANVEKLKIKLAWVRFEERRREVKAMKRNLTEAERRAREEREEEGPLEAAAAAAGGRAEAIKRGFEADKKRLHQLRTSEGASQDLTEQYGGEYARCRVALQQLQARRRRLEERLQEAQLARTRCEKEAKRLAEEVDVADVKRQLREIQPAARDAADRGMQLEDRMADDKAERAQVDRSRRSKQQQLAKLRSVKESRIRHVSQMRPGQDAVQLWHWLQRNRGMFRAEVYGPIAAEVTVSERRNAKILEHHVQNNVWCSFVVQNKHDYELLIDVAKNRTDHKFPRGGLSVQIGTVAEGRLRPEPRYYGAAAWGELQGRGVDCYMGEVFEAPDAVKQYLIDQSGVGSAVIGGPDAERAIADPQFDMLSKLSRGKNCCIYTYSQAERGGGEVVQQYLGTVSRYSGQLSTLVREVQDAKVLGGGEDREGIQRLENAIEADNARVVELEARMQETADQLAEQAQQRKALKDSQAELQAQIKKVQEAQRRLALAEDRARQAEEPLREDAGAERAAIETELRGAVAQNVASLRDLQRCQAELLAAEAGQQARKLKYTVARAAADAARRAYEKVRARNSHLEEETNRLRTEYTAAYAELDIMHDEAKEIGDIEQSEELVSELFGDDSPFKDLTTSDAIEERMDYEEQEANSIVDNPEVLRKYQENVAATRRAEAQLQELIEAAQSRDARFGETKVKWERKVETAVARLNQHFKKYMNQMNYGGAVELFKTAGYENFAIQIKVSYRQGEPLKVLDGRVNSGGERSVATVIYLMALQDMISSPFRVVDEINQGMDERNERMVFSRIVRNCCGDRRPQYFLITPKLLQGLVAMDHPDVRAHVICNGPWNIKNCDKWQEVMERVHARAVKRRRINPAAA